MPFGAAAPRRPSFPLALTLALAALLPAAAGGSLDPGRDFVRGADPAALEALLDYAHGTLAPALAARCTGTGVLFPTPSRNAWGAGPDRPVRAGADGWTTPIGTAGTRLAPVLFHDADGDGLPAGREPAWLDADGDGRLSPADAPLSDDAGALAAAAGRPGRPAPGRYLAATPGPPGPDTDVWLEDAAADRADLTLLHAVLPAVCSAYVDRTDPAAEVVGDPPLRRWTAATLAAALGLPELSPPPLPGADPAALAALRAWAVQTAAALALLTAREAPPIPAVQRFRHLDVVRGPLYEVRLTARGSVAHCGHVYPVAPYDGLLVWTPARYGNGQRQLDGRWSIGLTGGSSWRAPGPAPELFAFVGQPQWETGMLAAWWYACVPTPGAAGCNSGGYRCPDVCPAETFYLGTYSLTHLETECGEAPHLAVAELSAPENPRSLFAVQRRTGPEVGEYARWEPVLPATTTARDLFDLEWPLTLPWDRPGRAGHGTVQVDRTEYDANPGWSDGAGEQLEMTATAAVFRPVPPPDCRLELWLRTIPGNGTVQPWPPQPPDTWRLHAVVDGSAGPTELVFEPQAVPAVPDPSVPGGSHLARAATYLEMRGVLRRDGAPGFAPLPPPPELPDLPAAALFEADTDRDDLVDLGVDLLAPGADTGTAALRPEWPRPRLFLPLAVAQWDELAVHACLVQGAAAAPPGLAFTLDTRAWIERHLPAADPPRKTAVVVRPAGNRVAFDFPWDAAQGRFSPLGFPAAPNARRTYVLRDTTPDRPLDACFELHFDSGIIHVYAGADRAEGRLAEVRHADGRAVRPDRLQGCAADPAGGTFRSPRYAGSLQWDAGRPVRAVYTAAAATDPDAAPAAIVVDLESVDTPAGTLVAALRKSVPALSVAVASFGLDGGEARLVHGDGTVVLRRGDSIRRWTPGLGWIETGTLLNADGLPVRIATRDEAGNSRVLELSYAAAAGRAAVNGAALWAKPVLVSHPDGGWERFAHCPDTGWPLQRTTPFGDAPPDAPDALCRTLSFAYGPPPGDSAPADPRLLVELPRLTVERTLGIETGRLHAARTVRSDGRRTLRRRRAAVQGAAWDDPANVEFLEVSNRLGPPDRTGPDGTVSAAARLDGDTLRLDLTDARGRLHAARLNAFGRTVDFRLLEDWRLIRDLELLLDWFGDPDRAAVGRRICETDAFGRILRTVHADGSAESVGAFDPHGEPTAAVDRDGLALEIVRHPSGLPAELRCQGIATAFTYDAWGRPAGVAQQAGSLRSAAELHLDGLGRLCAAVDPLGARTEGAVDGGVVTTVLPDGGTLREQRRRDGSPAWRGGTAAGAEERFDQGVEPDGTTWTRRRRRTEAGFAEATTWRRNFLGQIVQIETGRDGAPPEAVHRFAWDAAGRLRRATDPDGTTLLADYDERGDLARIAVDLDGDGGIGPADRTAAFDRCLERAVPPDGGPAVLCRRETLFPPGGAPPVDTWTAVDGSIAWTATAGRTAWTRNVRGPGPGERTETTVRPDGTRTVVHCTGGLPAARRRVAADGSETASETLVHDALGRLAAVVDGRTGTAATVELDPAGRPVRLGRSDDPGALEIERDPAGRPVAVHLPGGGTVRRRYNPDGTLAAEAGDGTAPLRLDYDPRGLAVGLTAWRDRPDGDDGSETAWERDPATGLPRRRRVAGRLVEEWRWTPAGRLAEVVRHGPGGPPAATAFAYDAAGELAAIARSDGSPDTRFGRDAAGHLVQVDDALGRHGFERDAEGRVVAETFPLLPGTVLHRTWDAVGRPAGIALRRHGATLLERRLDYDPAGRLRSVGDGRIAVHYAYLPGSDLAAAATVSADGTAALRTAWTWDARGRLEALRADLDGPAAAPVFAWACTYDAAGRRSAVDEAAADPGRPGRSVPCRWEYAYGPGGALAAAVGRRPGDRSLLPGRSFDFSHDALANRTAAARDGDRSTARHAPDNRLVQRTVPGVLHLCGDAEPGVRLALDGRPVAADAEGRFHLRLEADNAAGPAAVAAAILAARPDAADDGEDRLALIPVQAELPAADERFPEAARGMGGDSLRRWRWDADGRLAEVELLPPPGTAAPPRRVAWLYDWMGRRAARTVRRLDAHRGVWVPESATLYVHDGWDLLAEFDLPVAAADPDPVAKAAAGRGGAGEPRLQHSFLYGLDLDGWRSGRPGRGAGGIGALLAVALHLDPDTPEAPGPGRPRVLLAVCDPLGSVRVLVDPDRAAVVESADFAPFGTLLERRRAGSAAAARGADPSLCPFGFAGRELDPLAALACFPRRWYSPDLGRWISPDPLAEAAGPNLHAYCNGDPVNHVDPWGLYGMDVHFFVTYYLMRAVGHNPQTAYTVSAFAQYVDDAPETTPGGDGRLLNLLRRGSVLRDFHFWGSTNERYIWFGGEALVVQAGSCAGETLEAARGLAAGMDRDGNVPIDKAILLGRWLHTFQDTYSHQGWTAFSSNANAGDDLLGTITRTPVLFDLPVLELLKLGHVQAHDPRTGRKRGVACDLPTLNAANHAAFLDMAGAVFDILGQSGGNPALSRERTLANLAAVFAVRDGDLGLRTTKTRIADRNIAAMAHLIARGFPNSQQSVINARYGDRFGDEYPKGLPPGYRCYYQETVRGQE